MYREPRKEGGRSGLLRRDLGVWFRLEVELELLVGDRDRAFKVSTVSLTLQSLLEVSLLLLFRFSLCHWTFSASFHSCRIWWHHKVPDCTFSIPLTRSESGPKAFRGWATFQLIVSDGAGAIRRMHSCLKAFKLNNSIGKTKHSHGLQANCSVEVPF